MAERKQKTSAPRKQESVQINDATRREIEFLKERGYGSLTEIVRPPVHAGYLMELEIIQKHVSMTKSNQP